MDRRLDFMTYMFAMLVYEDDADVAMNTQKILSAENIEDKLKHLKG